MFRFYQVLGVLTIMFYSILVCRSLQLCKIAIIVEQVILDVYGPAGIYQKPKALSTLEKCDTKHNPLRQ